jgi:GTPase SAR1 family protein
MNFLASAPQSQKYKIYILGDTKVGKSCIYNRYIADTFIERYLSTISVAYTTKKLELRKTQRKTDKQREDITKLTSKIELINKILEA